MTEHDSIKKLDDQDMEKVVGGIGGWSQSIPGADTSSAGLDLDAGSLENRIRRPLPRKVQPKRR